MESATLRTRSLSGPAQAGLLSLLLAAAAVAWVLSDGWMAGMDDGPGSELGGLAWFAGVWLVMMAAMMLPSSAPAVLAYAGAERPTGSAARSRHTAAFVAGYLLAWSATGLAAYLMIESVRGLDLALLEWGAAGPYVAGSVILAAAAYELSPLKQSCLRHCREPRELLEQDRHARLLAALRAGIEHGSCCVGCCLALMAVLFAVGVMSLTWMAVVATLIAAEKLLPSPATTRRAIAASLAALALAVAFVPGKVPALSTPGSTEMGSMQQAPMSSPGMDQGDAMPMAK